MIGILLIIATIMFFCAWNLCHHHTKVYALFASVFLLATISCITLNFHNHLGMHTRTVATKYHIQSANKQAHILIYEPIGSKRKHQVILYKRNKIRHTSLNIKNKSQIIRTNKNYGYIQKTLKQWRYTKQGKFWFYLMKPTTDSNTISTKLYIPKSWTVLSANQAKAVKNIAKYYAIKEKKQISTPQAKIMLKQKLQTIVQQQIKIKAMKNPAILQSQSTKAKVIKKVTQQVKEQFMHKEKQQTLKQAIQQAKQLPVGYKA